MKSYLTVSGAHGRNYSSGKTAKADWVEGKDFIIRTLGPSEGAYIGKEDADKEGITVNIRYNQDRGVVVVPPAKPPKG